jgi:hypothetical protein
VSSVDSSIVGGVRLVDADESVNAQSDFLVDELPLEPKLDVPSVEATPIFLRRSGRAVTFAGAVARTSFPSIRTSRYPAPCSVVATRSRVAALSDEADGSCACILAVESRDGVTCGRSGRNESMILSEDRRTMKRWKVEVGSEAAIEQRAMRQAASASDQKM